MDYVIKFFKLSDFHVEGEKRNQIINYFCEYYGTNIKNFRNCFQTVSHSVKKLLII